MSLQNLVRVFNALPRSPKTPSGLIDNHWQFAIQHVALEPSGDLLHVVNPGSLYNHTEGPAQILSEPTPEAQADVALPLLLSAFTSGAGTEGSPLAPWSWGTNDEVFAKALEGRLKSAGVRRDLCKIEIGNEGFIAIQQAEWQKLFEVVKKHAGPRCNKCRQQPDDLKLCSGCKKVKYCSKECQKADWKEHKVSCKYLAKGMTSSLDPMKYYQTVAPNTRDAQELARGIGLRFPDEGGPGGLSYPVRRLVVTGKDTPENLISLLGRNDTKDIKEAQKEARMEALLRSPPGSPNHALHAMLDVDCPPWTPREPSVDEQAELTKIRDMQAIITSHFGSRGVRNICAKDMQQILVGNFGANWPDAVPIYQTALNAMDQGVGR